MKRTILFIILAPFLFSACGEKDDDFIATVVENIAKTESIHYKFTQKFYYSNGQDTTTTPCEVWAVRDKNEALRNGYVWVNDYYRPYHMMYDNGNFYLAIPPKKVTAVYKEFSGSFISPGDWIDAFLKPDLFKKQFADSLNIISLSDTVYNGEDCKKAMVKFPADKKKGELSYTYIFSKKNFMPLWVMAKTSHKDYTYFDELYFSEYEFNNVSLEELQKRQAEVIAANPIDEKTANSELSKLESMLHIGENAPIVEGAFYTDNSDFNLSDYIGKNIIIIDFWYTHCPPCVKSMPSLVELHQEYKDKGLKIFGVNSVDNQPHSLDNLDRFLSKRDISYDIVMIKPEVDLMYKIKSYPTMYVIDLNGKVSLVEIGFNDEKFEALKKKIAALTQNS